MKVGTYFCYQLYHPSRLFTKVLKVIKWEVVNSQSTKECLSLSMLPRWFKYGKVRLVMSVGMWSTYYICVCIHFWTNFCEMDWKKFNSQLTTECLFYQWSSRSFKNTSQYRTREQWINHESFIMLSYSKKTLGYLSFVFISKLDFTPDLFYVKRPILAINRD